MKCERVKQYIWSAIGAFLVIMVGKLIIQIIIPQPTIIQSVYSPDKKHIAYVFQSDAGSTTDFIYHVSVLGADKTLGKGNGNICTSEQSLSVKWRGASTLFVKNSGNCTSQKIKKNGITIEYNSYKRERELSNIKLELKNDSTQELLKQVEQTVISEMYGDVSLQLIDMEYIPDFKSGYVSLRYLIPNKPIGENAESILSVGLILKEKMVDCASEYGLDRANISHPVNIAQWKLGKSEVEEQVREKNNGYEIFSIEGHCDTKRGEEWLVMVEDLDGQLIYLSTNPYSGEMKIVEIL